MRTNENVTIELKNGELHTTRNKMTQYQIFEKLNHELSILEEHNTDLIKKLERVAEQQQKINSLKDYIENLYPLVEADKTPIEKAQDIKIKLWQNIQEKIEEQGNPIEILALYKSKTDNLKYDRTLVNIKCIGLNNTSFEIGAIGIMNLSNDYEFILNDQEFLLKKAL